MTYFPLKDCQRTFLPAPPGFKDGDLVQDAGAPDHIIDKVGTIKYPLNIRKVQVGEVMMEKSQQAGALSGAGSTPPLGIAKTVVKGVINSSAASPPTATASHGPMSAAAMVPGQPLLWRQLMWDLCIIPVRLLPASHRHLRAPGRQ